LKAKSGLKIKKIGLVVKHHQPEAAALALSLARHIIISGFKVVFAQESVKLARDLQKQLRSSRELRSLKVEVVPKTKMVQVADLIVVLGGDGTFISIARLMRDRSVPVVGVNMGQLGFLTEIKKNEALEALDHILSGEPQQISKRSLLEVTLLRDGKVIFQGPVVNDAVISKGAIARIIGMDVEINGRWVSRVRADGLIISTPTGSTAYSLAAGGPIIEPSLSALILTPICPHSLTQRPLVISDQLEIRVCLKDRPGHVFLTLDGQDAVDMKEGDTVVVKKFKKHSLLLISSPARDYFSVLREKLKFGMRD
jgi:NAD+ kinase